MNDDIDLGIGSDDDELEEALILSKDTPRESTGAKLMKRAISLFEINESHVNESDSAYVEKREQVIAEVKTLIVTSDSLSYWEKLRRRILRFLVGDVKMLTECELTEFVEREFNPPTVNTDKPARVLDRMYFDSALTEKEDFFWDHFQKLENDEN
jgi:hypothetical protein